MAAIEWGILPITDRFEIENGVYTVAVEVEDWFYRAIDAVARVLESIRWEESGHNHSGESPNRAQIEGI